MRHASTRSTLGMVALLLALREACAARFLVRTNYPPRLYRADAERGVVQWDTGQIARAIVFSRGTVVDYNGIRTLPLSTTPAIAGYYAEDALICEEWHDALCRAPDNRTTAFAATAPIIVRLTHDGSLPPGLNKIIAETCTSRGSGHGRVARDERKYDLSACDADAMTHSFFLAQDKLYFIPLPFSPWAHFLLCCSAVFTLSGVLYILKPRALQAEKAAAVGTPLMYSHMSVSAQQMQQYKRTLDYVFANTFAGVLASAAVQTVFDTFLSREDRWCFLFLCITFVFYFALAMTVRIRESQHEPGLAVDTCITGISIVCVATYSTQDHPFALFMLAFVVFRLWNKLIRFAFGDGYLATVPLVVIRLLLDSVNACMAISYGWNAAFALPIVSGFWFLPLVLVTFVAAKYVFLLNTLIS